MSRPRTCIALETDLIAAASDEASVAAAERVDKHLVRCERCSETYARYRSINAVVGELKAATMPASDAARDLVLARLADLRSRLVRYGVFPTPLGPVLLAATEQGISLVEYVRRSDGSDSWLLRQPHVEPDADRAPLQGFHDELMNYLAGRTTGLDWPLDLRFVRSEFQRAVLRATAQVPYGAVTSYAGIAGDIGRPKAVRAVATALRRNPVPIIIPCHRIVGSGGLMVGYSGTRVGLKEHLLAVEGVRLERGRRQAEVDRTAMYAWDRRDRTYCLPTCGAISRQPIGAVTLFASPREAEAVGLTPCNDCRPDLHPLSS